MGSAITNASLQVDGVVAPVAADRAKCDKVGCGPEAASGEIRGDSGADSRWGISSDHRILQRSGDVFGDDLFQALFLASVLGVARVAAFSLNFGEGCL